MLLINGTMFAVFFQCIRLGDDFERQIFTVPLCPLRIVGLCDAGQLQIGRIDTRSQFLADRFQCRGIFNAISYRAFHFSSRRGWRISAPLSPALTFWHHITHRCASFFHNSRFRDASSLILKPCRDDRERVPHQELGKWLLKCWSERGAHGRRRSR